MKKIIVVLVALMSHGVFAQNAVRSFAGDDILKSITPSHPRLLLLKGEEQKVLQQVKASKELSKVHREILAECDRIIELPPVEHVKIGRRLLDKSRECLRRVFMLSYAYRTPERRNI
jgi:hypothetical protein